MHPVKPHGTPPDATPDPEASFLCAESCGAHYRTDAPETRAAWRGRIHRRRGQQPRLERISM